MSENLTITFSTTKDINSLKVPDLRLALEERGQDSTGDRPQLRIRLKEWAAAQASDGPAVEVAIEQAEDKAPEPEPEVVAAPEPEVEKVAAPVRRGGPADRSARVPGEAVEAPASEFKKICKKQTVVRLHGSPTAHILDRPFNDGGRQVALQTYGTLVRSFVNEELDGSDDE